jgi:hypothetical protein
MTTQKREVGGTKTKSNAGNQAAQAVLMVAARKNVRTANTSSAYANKDEVSPIAEGESAPLVAGLMLRSWINYNNALIIWATD